MLDGYVYGEKKRIKVKNKEYEIQMFQGEHRSDYLLSEMSEGKVDGHCNLFHNGLLVLSYIIKDGERIGDISEYSEGKALSKEGWNGLLGHDDYRIIENSKKGLELVIRAKDNNCVIYRGEFDEELNRNGKGIEYDGESGEMRYEGYWVNDELLRIVKEFDGDEMIEYEDCDNVDVLKRIPLYVGGYNVINGDIKRNGIGYLIDGKNGTAIRESEWLNGEEVSSIDLHNGWYVDGINESIRSVLADEQPLLYDEPNVHDKLVEVHSSIDMNDVTINVTNLVISSNCCNDITYLELNSYDRLQLLDIGDECFENVDTIRIDGLNRLKSIKIGMNSFTKRKNSYGNNPSRSFHILNCAILEWIEIGRYCFSDYGGGFELKNLHSLSKIKIGEIGSDSYNFSYSSFVVKDLPNLQYIQLGKFAFQETLTTVISNLPNLKSIQLGAAALWGRYGDSACSLEMKDLPKLEEITSDRYTFVDPCSVILSNIPNLKTVNLPNSFKEVKTKTISTDDVSPLLAKLIKIKK